MPLNQKNIKINNFDFSKIKNAQMGDFDYFTEEKEKELKQKIKTKPAKKSNKFGWFLVLILFISLLALSTFTLDEMRRKNQLLADYKSPNQIAGIFDQNVPIAPITGDWFSILPKEKPPIEFQKTKSLEKSNILNDRQASNTTYIAEVDSSNNTKLKSGIEISVIEYDNRYNSKQLAETVVQKLGSNMYEIKDSNIEIPKNIKLTKIETSINSDNISYYTTVTSDNYYIIKVYNQTSKDSKYNKITKFTNSILENLYLN
jgi:hypothetical protein